MAVAIPKFHSEFNWIEYYWGACADAIILFTSLREIVPKALESISPSLVHKYWARSKRILNSYCTGAVHGDEQSREHVYRSNRKISGSAENSLRV
jgi:hypothetical protein